MSDKWAMISALHASNQSQSALKAGSKESGSNALLAVALSLIAGLGAIGVFAYKKRKQA